jgi:hypothetical protein
MQTTTIKLFGKTVATYGKRKRFVENRFGMKRGSTFMGLHTGKTSHYLSVPALAKRKFGGVQDIVNIT